MSLWSREYWLTLRQTHLTRVAPAADAFVLRRSRDEKHPVHDFLFTYYNFSPAKLKQWLPPHGVTLEVTATDLMKLPWMLKVPVIHESDHLQLDAKAIKPHLKDLARWVMTLCDNIQTRAPRFRCFGLHEWAMVYQQSRDEIRHQGHELRLSPEELASFVESQSICCSHYDAFRFFTPTAKPMNVLQPVLDTRLDMEQGACLHVNMDLYKWASKLWPWIGSDLIGECFELAQEGRDLDMRASPYDLAHLGYQPVFIETATGRTQYEKEQRGLAAKAEPLRNRLRAAAQAIAES
jgi:hypothetical protein